MNILLRSRIMTGNDKGKQPEESGWVHRAPEKETGFDLEHAKEKFMEEKKSFTKASTSESQNKLLESSVPIEVDPSVLTTVLEIRMKLLRNSKALKGLHELINKCTSKDNAPDGPRVVRKIGKHKVRTGRKMRLTAQIGDYEMDQFILGLGYDANVLPKQA